MHSAVEVRVDDRLRLAGALLAAGEWPEHEQVVKAYKPHRVAESARKYFSAYRDHAAVTRVQSLVGGGEGMRQLYGYALNADWPDELATQIEDFKSTAQAETFWEATQADWQQAESDAREVLSRADLGQFVSDLFGAQTRSLIFAPNLLFPGQQSVTVSSPDEVVVAAPPPKAWGASPPWRYSERPDEVLAALSEAFARFLFESNLPAEHVALQPRAEVFALAAAVLFLRQAEGDAAGDQFMVMEKKTRGLKTLPATVSALEGILAERRAGNYNSFLDYLPQLVKRL